MTKRKKYHDYDDLTEFTERSVRTIVCDLCGERNVVDSGEIYVTCDGCGASSSTDELTFDE